MNRMIAIGILLSAIAGCGDGATGPGVNDTINLTVFVTEEDGTPVHRAVVSTIPATSEITTDEMGSGTFNGIVQQPYFFVINPPGRPTYQYYLTLEDADTDSLSLTIITEPPKVDILFPVANNIVSTETAFFSGSAIDHEDGPVPDSLLVWSLDNSETEGTGREISIAGLSAGNHTITLTAYDSDGKSSSALITVVAAQYLVSDYFPLVNGAEWSYTHAPAQFNMYNHQQILERWSLDNVTVRIDDAGRRISTMTYRATALSNVRHYRYQVIDEFQETGNGLVITGTTEAMQIWRNTTAGQPNEYLRIETDYDPAYPVLSNTIAPGEGGIQSYSGTAEVTWTYIGIDHGTTSFVEKPSISVTISAGSPETVSLNGKTIETVPLTITDGDSQRKWWLAPGYGIIRFQYNSFNANPVASLIGTNLATNKTYPLNLKATLKRVTGDTVIGGKPDSEFEYLRNVRTIMRASAP